MDKIDQIRAEIERLKEKYTNMMPSIQKCSVCDELLSFLDTLKEQPVDFPTTDEEMAKFLATHPKVEVPEKYKTPDWMFEKSEKPTTAEGLEEAARHSEILTYPMPEDGDIDKVMKVQEARIFHEIGFKAGAKWQKEQMLKGAKDGYVSDIIIHNDGDEEHYAVTYPNGERPHSITDKVKIIIL